MSILPRILWGMHLADAALDRTILQRQQRYEAARLNALFQQLEAQRMAPVVDSVRHSHVPTVLNAGAPRMLSGADVPVGMDEGMVRMASIQKVAEIMARQDVAYLRRLVEERDATLAKQAGISLSGLKGAVGSAVKPISGVLERAAGAFKGKLPSVAGPVTPNIKIPPVGAPAMHHPGTVFAGGAPSVKPPANPLAQLSVPVKERAANATLVRNGVIPQAQAESLMRLSDEKILRRQLAQARADMPTAAAVPAASGSATVGAHANMPTVGAPAASGVRDVSTVAAKGQAVPQGTPSIVPPTSQSGISSNVALPPASGAANSNARMPSVESSPAPSTSGGSNFDPMTGKALHDNAYVNAVEARHVGAGGGAPAVTSAPPPAQAPTPPPPAPKVVAPPAPSPNVAPPTMPSAASMPDAKTVHGYGHTVIDPELATAKTYPSREPAAGASPSTPTVQTPSEVQATKSVQPSVQTPSEFQQHQAWQQEQRPAMQQQLADLKKQMAQFTPEQRASGKADAVAAQHAALSKQLADRDAEYAKAYEAQHGISLADARAQAEEAAAAADADKKPGLLQQLKRKATVAGGLGALGLAGAAYGGYKLLDKGLDVLGEEGREGDRYGTGMGSAPTAVNQYGVPMY